MNIIKKFVYYTLQIVLGVPAAIITLGGTVNHPVTNALVRLLDWFIKDELDREL